ncbi:MAG: bifunctional shikimate kinase/3-dehydroquinate synthase [Acidimicrobiaceae bacterium]|nr:bifunctional shikimate kinase/3-dehydroquinate synthase [Acidimicrobiaceae bacterium]
MIVLMGFMGAGKTTVGYLLAEKLGLPFIDVDARIERSEQRTVRQIFDDDGEATFRQLEHCAVLEILAGPDAVVALGGGAVEHAGTRLALEGAIVVYLEVDFEEAILRIGADVNRPMISVPGVREIYARRLPIYRSVSTLCVSTGGRSPEAVAKEILEAVVAPDAVPSGTRSVLITPMGGVHQVHIGDGLTGNFAQLLPTLRGAERVFVITSPADLLLASEVAWSLELKGLRSSVFTVPEGVDCKTLEIANQVFLQLAEGNANCDDVVVGLGDDSLCYLVGFVAATFNRGVKLALIPTTLLGQVDLAIGGKNGVNLAQGSDLVGAIYQPIVVVDDVALANARRSDGFLSGIAEVLKYAFIADESLLGVLEENASEILAGDVDLLREVVTRSVEIKAQVVTADQREHGAQINLDYGHAFAHAFEHLLEFRADRHGEALALGMMAAAHLSLRQGRIGNDLLDLHRKLLSLYGLPMSGEFSLPAMRQTWVRYRKYRNGVRFVVLNGIGRPEGGVFVSDELLQTVLSDLAG